MKRTEKMRFVTFLLALIIAQLPETLFAQNDSILEKLKPKESISTNSTDSAKAHTFIEMGRVIFYSDSSITNLEKSTRGFKDTRGYRIQLMLGPIQSIRTERNKFLSLGLSYPAYLKQIVPEYSLLVGDFTNRLDAEKHLQIIQQYYPKAFTVVEIIEPPKYSTHK